MKRKAEVIRLKISLYGYCTERGRLDLLEQWDAEKNGSLTPRQVSYGSKKKVWWLCQEGHSWQTAVCTRTGQGSGCPYCAGKKPWPGQGDLASRRPDLAAQWHPVKNRGVTPADLLPGSQYKAWWVCERGHEWQAAVKSRVNGSGCPVCVNQALRPGVNDLAATHPELLPQWHPTKNGELTPQGLMAGTRRRVWWVCEKGHEWQASVLSRANGSGCPVCSGKKVVPGVNDLATHFPEIAAQWHPTKNGAMTARSVSPYSNRKVWWRCSLGHEYQARVGARTQRISGCPYCANRKVLPGFNDLATRDPKVAAQWHPTLNGTLTPRHVTAGSHRKAWWQCQNGHVWKAIIYSRAGPGSRKCGCPVCAGKINSDRMERYWLSAAGQNAPSEQSGLAQKQRKDGKTGL